MKHTELIKLFGDVQVNVTELKSLEKSHLVTEDSRKVVSGGCFVAIAGNNAVRLCAPLGAVSGSADVTLPSAVPRG